MTWGYDNSYRLTSEARTGAVSYTSTFTYDDAGNRKTEKKDGVTTTFSYDLADQITTSVDSGGTSTYTYDGAGNQTLVVAPGSQKTTSTWNDENKRTQVKTPSATMDCKYRYDGLRFEKQDSGGTTKFIYDGQNYLAETNSAGTVQATYTVAPSTYAQTVSRRTTSSVYYHADAITSVRALTNSSQTATDTYDYDAWGTEVNSTGSTSNSLKWCGAIGYYFDEDAGTHYVRARNYSSKQTRWMSKDPIGLRSGDVNLYRYVFSNPIFGLDPTGLATLIVDSDVRIIPIIIAGSEAEDVPPNQDPLPDTDGIWVGGKVKGHVGVTVVAMTLDYHCDKCCIDGVQRYEVNDIVMSVFIFVMVDNSYYTQGSYPEGSTPRGTIGHEQMHVERIKYALEKQRARIERDWETIEGECGFAASENQCNQRMWNAWRGIRSRVWEFVIKPYKGHAGDPDTPLDGPPAPAEGDIPSEPGSTTIYPGAHPPLQPGHWWIPDDYKDIIDW
ncbi:RHS repeat domain-containing protein [Planctomycetota bacterium]